MTDVDETAVARHYALAGLGKRILDAIERCGLDPDHLAPGDLAPVDELHIGGRAATAHVAGLMELAPGTRVLDLGCGIGGAARYLASEWGCRVSGIDLTPEFVDIARLLTARTGLADRVDLRIGSVLDLPWPDAHFDAAISMHVAMNIAGRPRLYEQAARVIRPGGTLAIYDAMKGPADGMPYPLPWADTPEISFLVTAAGMRVLLDRAGFDIRHEQSLHEAGTEDLRARIARAAEAGGPPPLGVHLVQGPNAGQKARNLLSALDAGQVTPVVFIARRRP